MEWLNQLIKQLEELLLVSAFADGDFPLFGMAHIWFGSHRVGFNCPGPVTLSDQRNNSADFQNVSPSASAGGTQRDLPEEEAR